MLFENGMILPTLYSDEKLTLQTGDPPTIVGSVNQVTVTMADQVAHNGLVHIISDVLLLPQEQEPPPSSPTNPTEPTNPTTSSPTCRNPTVSDFEYSKDYWGSHNGWFFEWVDEDKNPNNQVCAGGDSHGCIKHNHNKFSTYNGAFVAPSKFRGNQRLAKNLSFDLWTQATNNNDLSFDNTIVYMSRGSMKLHYKNIKPLKGVWEHYSIPMTTGHWELPGGCTLDDCIHQEDLDYVLADIEVLRIRGDFENGRDNKQSRLDNVVMEYHCTSATLPSTTPPPLPTTPSAGDTPVLEGIYYIKQRSTGLYLDVYNKAGRSNVVLRPVGNVESSQEWEFTPEGFTYRLEHVNTGMYLSGTESNNFPWMSTSTGRDQEWLVRGSTPIGEDTTWVRFETVEGHKRLDAAHSESNNYRAALANKNAQARQKWWIDPVGDVSGTFTLKQQSLSRYLDYDDDAREAVTRYADDEESEGSQQWKLHLVNVVYRIRHVGTSPSHYLDAYNIASSADGSVVTRGREGNDSQLWLAEYKGDSTFILRQLHEFQEEHEGALRASRDEFCIEPDHCNAYISWSYDSDAARWVIS